MPVTCDSNTHSLSTGDICYTVIHTTSDSNLPSHAPSKSDLINQTSGTQTLSAGSHSAQTHFKTDPQNVYTQFTSGTSSCGSSHASEARTKNISVKEMDEVKRVLVQTPGITLVGQVTEEERGLHTISSFNTGETKRISAPDLRFLPLPRSPLVARQKPDLNLSDPSLNRRILLSSHTVSLRTVLAQNDRLESHLNRAQSLPPAKVEVLYAGDADELHPCPAVPHYASVREVPITSLPTKTSGKDENTLEERRALSEVPTKAGVAVTSQQMSEIEPLKDEKVKKRSSLFSPRKNRKSGNLSGETQHELGKHKSLWKSVFSGYKKEKKRKEVESYCRTLPSSSSLDCRKKTPGFRRTSGKKKKSVFAW